jgi:hypothetical protein
MRSFSVILALLFAFAATSYAWPGAEFPTLEVRKHGEGNSTKSNNPENVLKKSCKKMRKLNALSQIAANQTKLDAWVTEGKLNTAEVDALKAKAANATAELKTLQSNTTLVSECAIVNAERKSVGQCMQMKMLTKLAALAGNETAMTAFEEKKKLNETGIEKLKTRIAEAQTKLKDLQSNITLTDFCTQRAQQQQQKGGGESSPNNLCNITDTPQTPPPHHRLVPLRVSLSRLPAVRQVSLHRRCRTFSCQRLLPSLLCSCKPHDNGLHKRQMRPSRGNTFNEVTLQFELS